MLTNQKLKEIILESDVISSQELNEAFLIAEQNKRTLADVLIEKDLISDENLGQLIASVSGWNFVNLKRRIIPVEGLEILPELMARKQLAIIFSVEKDSISLALSDPDNIEILRALEKKSNKTIKPYFATERDIKQALIHYRKGLTTEFSEIINLSIEAKKNKQNTEEDVVIKIVDAVINYAYESLASDIHIEPRASEIVVRFRIDGILHDVATVPLEFLDAIITRIKIMARLRTDEHRAAQDGKLTIKLTDEDLDVRVSIVPITSGEKIVMRLLAEKVRQFALDDLGLSQRDATLVREVINKPHGMILVTGPTGSGKTTSLYAVLKILNNREVNIATIEDPVEYQIEGVNQIQVNTKTNLTFASGLRSIVRQDPDIIMVGEIRDEETAGIAVNAALTGHLVLSTLHTNDAATTLPRLLDMKIEPFLVASTVNIIIAQRLVRRVCSQCLTSDLLEGERLEFIRKQIDVEKLLNKKTKVKELRMYKGKGCPVCNFTGYKGRIGIFEVISMSDPIRNLIVQKADASQIKKQAISEGMSTMMEDGFMKAMQGMTTCEELFKSTSV